MTQELNLKLSVQDINVTLAGLAELPAKASYDLINNIKAQAQTQLMAATTATEETSQAEKPQLLTEDATQRN